MADATETLSGLGILYNGIDTSEGSATSSMQAVAIATNSLVDEIDDGVLDDLLVCQWSSRTGSRPEFPETIVGAIRSIVETCSLGSIRLEAEDTEGFFIGMDPSAHDYVNPDTSLEIRFQLEGTVAATTDDQLFLVSLFAQGDGELRLGS